MNLPQFSPFLLALAISLSSWQSLKAEEANGAKVQIPPAASMRIKRGSHQPAPQAGKASPEAIGQAPGKSNSSKPILYGSVQHNKTIPNKQALVPQEAGLDSLVKSQDYSAPFNGNAAINTGSIQSSPSKPPATYKWGQSDTGGYYDASGQIKETVMGDMLYKYGGTFMDGTQVPKMPVVCNFKGHVYKPYVPKRSP